MADAETQWLSTAQSLGLDEPAADLLPDEVKAAFVTQMHAFMEAGDYRAALEPGWLLVYDDPWNRDCALDFALCLQHLDELEAACRFYSTALLLDATDAYCLYRIGECLQTLGDLEDARAAFQGAVELSRDDAAFEAVRQQAEQRLDELAETEA